MTSLSLPPTPPLKNRPPAGIKSQPARFSVSVSFPPSVLTVIEPVIVATGTLTVFGLTCVIPNPALIVLFGSVMRIFGPLHEIVSVSLDVPPFPSVIVRLPPETEVSVSGGTTPVPVRATSKGFSSESLFAIWSAATREPPAPGVNVTVNAVLPPGATVALMPARLGTKSPEFVPSTVTPVIFNVTLPVFLIVNVLAGAATPTFELPKASVETPSVRSLPIGSSTAISGAPHVPRRTETLAEL